MKVNWYGDKLPPMVEKVAMEALHDSGEIIIAESDEDIPWASGDMASNSFITDAPGEKAVYIGYNGRYVIKQHQDPTLRHPDPTNPESRAGRTDHFLSKAFDQNKEKAKELVKARVDAVLR